MNKAEFLALLKKELNGLPEDAVDSTIEYYSEILDDRIESGESEDEAVSSMESVEEIASRTMAEIPLSKLVRERVRPKKKIGALALTLIILGSPVWLSLGIVTVSVIISVYAALWSCVISLYAVFVSVAAVSVYALFSVVYSFIKLGAAQGVLWIGGALVCAGLSILLFVLSNLSVKAMVFLGKKMWFWIKSLFVRKEDK